MSRSMEQCDVEGTDGWVCSRIEAVFQAVSDFLDDSAKLIPSDQHDGIGNAYSLVLFSDQARAAFQVTSLSAARTELVAVKRRERPYGGTKYGEGLTKLSAIVEQLEQAAGGTRHVCIFLSDGKPGDHVAEGLVQKLEARLKPDRLKLHTVGFGMETRATWHHGLQKLAELGNGTFHDNSAVQAEAPEAAQGPVVVLRPAPPRDEEGSAASTRGAGEARAVPQSPRPSSAAAGSTQNAATQASKKTTVVTVKSSGRLSASQLSSTFSALAQSTLAESRLAEMRAPMAMPSCRSSAAASTMEDWDALRWVESDGVMKVAGHSGDVHAIDDDDVLKSVGDLSLKVRSVRWCPKPHAQGSMRQVHLMWDTTGGDFLPLVAKRPKKVGPLGGLIQASLATNRAFLEMHGHAAKCAAEFNRRLSSKAQRVHFLDAYVYFLVSPTRTIEHCFNAEPRLEGNYMKFNDNNGNVFSHHAESSRLAQAFSHFSYDYADTSSIIVDIQGVHCEWTDPQMHSECGGRYGPGDLGHAGIKKFFASHKCNDYCKHLELQHPNLPESSQLGDDEVWPVGGAVGASVVNVPSTLAEATPLSRARIFANIPSLCRVIEEEEEGSAKRRRRDQRSVIICDSAVAPS